MSLRSKIIGKKIILREITSKDALTLLNLRNKYRKHFFDSKKISLEEQKKWLDNYFKKTNDKMFIIYHKNIPIGTIALYDITKDKRKAQIGRLIIDKPYQKKGLAKNAVLTLTSHALKKLKLKKIYLWTLGENLPAINLYGRCGFVKSGSKLLKTKKMIKMELEKK